MKKKAGKQNAAIALEYHTVVSVPAVQQRQRVAASIYTAVVAGSKKIKNERVTVQVSLCTSGSGTLEKSTKSARDPHHHYNHHHHQQHVHWTMCVHLAL